MDDWLAENDRRGSYAPASYLDTATIQSDIETVVRLAKKNPESLSPSVFCNVSDSPDFTAADAPLHVLLYDWMEGEIDMEALLGAPAAGAPVCRLKRVAKTGQKLTFGAGRLGPRELALLLWSIRAPGDQMIGFEYQPPLCDGEPAVLKPWVVVAAGAKTAAVMAHLALSPLPTGCYYLVSEGPTTFRAVRHGTFHDLGWFYGLGGNRRLM